MPLTLESSLLPGSLPLAPGRTYVFGRGGEGVDVVVDARWVSGRHFAVAADETGERVRVTDLGSTNGTRLGADGAGRCLRNETAALAIGEAFRAGDAVFRVVGSGAPTRLPKSAAKPSRIAPAPSANPPPTPPQPAGVKGDVARLVAEVNLTRTLVDYRRDIYDTVLGELKKVHKHDSDSIEFIARLVDQAMAAKSPPNCVPRAKVREVLLWDVAGFGPIDPLVNSTAIEEIMVNREDRIYIAAAGANIRTDGVFVSRGQLINAINRIVAKVGKQVDEARPLVDARLEDGSRVNAVIPPVAIDGPNLTIRRFGRDFSVEDLIGFGSFDERLAAFFKVCVEQKLNVLISGGTGSGKTTLLNVFSSFIPDTERIVTIEDTAELRLRQDHVVRLETKPANVEGKGGIAIRDLVINALRMRPDRIVVGECRGGEALDMIQAMNTGHDGSLTTLHANTPRDALLRLEVMCLMAGIDMPMSAIRRQIGSAVNLIIQIGRIADGSRKVECVTEVVGEQGTEIGTQDIFVFEQTGMEKGEDGKMKVQGHFSATGIIPRFYDTLRKQGIDMDRGIFRN